VYSALQLAFRVVLSLPDEMKVAMLDAVRAGQGWRGVLGVFAPVLEGNVAQDTRPVDEMKPGQQPREFWVGVGDRRSLTEAVERTGYSDKSVRDYLEKHEIEPRWGRKNGAVASED